MASHGEWLNALSGFQIRPEHREALAGHLSQTGVPLQHVSMLSGIYVGSGRIQHGAGAVYFPATKALHLPDPSGARRVSPAAEIKYRRTIAHEIGHAVSQHLNPDQFRRAVTTSSGTGLLEAHAENYADQAVPGSYSGYDYEASQGHMPESYRTGRGARFGNIDPRLRKTA